MLTQFEIKSTKNIIQEVDFTEINHESYADVVKMLSDIPRYRLSMGCHGAFPDIKCQGNIEFKNIIGALTYHIDLSEDIDCAIALTDLVYPDHMDTVSILSESYILEPFILDANIRQEFKERYLNYLFNRLFDEKSVSTLNDMLGSVSASAVDRVDPDMVNNIIKWLDKIYPRALALEINAINKGRDFTRGYHYTLINNLTEKTRSIMNFWRRLDLPIKPIGDDQSNRAERILGLLIENNFIPEIDQDYFLDNLSENGFSNYVKSFVDSIDVTRIDPYLRSITGYKMHKYNEENQFKRIEDLLQAIDEDPRIKLRLKDYVFDRIIDLDTGKINFNTIGLNVRLNTSLWRLVFDYNKDDNQFNRELIDYIDNKDALLCVKLLDRDRERFKYLLNEISGSSRAAVLDDGLGL